MQLQSKYFVTEDHHVYANKNITFIGQIFEVNERKLQF